MNVLWEKEIYGNLLIDYCFAGISFIIAMVILKLIHITVLRYAKKIAKKTSTSIDDFLVKSFASLFMPLSAVVLLFISSKSLTLSDEVNRSVNIVSIAILTTIFAKFFTALLTYGFDVYSRKRKSDLALERSLTGIVRILKISIWAIAICFFLDNLGIDISAVVAGLGIGGVAVALAAQAVLGDLFSYFAILFDRPFDVGDFIIVGDFLGVVERIGIKTTRLSSLGGEQLIFSNTDLTNSRVRNYKRMEKRRVLFKLGVIYQTSIEKVKEIPCIIEEAVKQVENTVFDRAHFFEYGDSSLIFEVVYYVLGSDYNKYMDIQQAINFSIMSKFADRKIEFAYPTQTLFIKQEN